MRSQFVADTMATCASSPGYPPIGKSCNESHVYGECASLGMIPGALAGGRIIKDPLSDFRVPEDRDIRKALAYAAILAQESVF